MTGTVSGAALTTHLAKCILEQPVFADPIHIEARKLLELADETQRTRTNYLARFPTSHPAAKLPRWATRNLDRMDEEQLDHELELWRKIGFGPDGELP